MTKQQQKTWANAMVILGIDYGTKRTGLAICDPMEVLAAPVEVLAEPNPKSLAQRIANIAQQRAVSQIVLGMPLRTDGTKGDRALATEAFAQTLQEHCGLPVLLRDERFTTIEAHRALHANHIKQKQHKKTVDAVAAVVLLQSYLEERKHAKS